MKLRIFLLAGLFVLGSIPVGACEKCITWTNIETDEITRECTNEYPDYAPRYAPCSVVSFCGRKMPGVDNNCEQYCDGELCVVA